MAIIEPNAALLIALIAQAAPSSATQIDRDMPPVASTIAQSAICGSLRSTEGLDCCIHPAVAKTTPAASLPFLSAPIPMAAAVIRERSAGDVEPR